MTPEERRAKREETTRKLMQWMTQQYQTMPTEGEGGETLDEIRAKRNRDMAYGKTAMQTMTGGMVPGAGEYGAIAGAQYEPLKEQAGAGITNASYLLGLTNPAFALNAMVAPGLTAGWKKVWQGNVDSGVRKTLRDADIVSKGAKAIKGLF